MNSMVLLQELLCIEKGITAVIGSGGKTSLIKVLGEELSESASVLLCTSTKIRPFAELSRLTDLPQSPMQTGLWWCGSDLEKENKVGPPEIEFETLAKYYDYVLVEADGSAGLPAKAHAAHEPVIPVPSNQIISVFGASAFNEPVCSAAHRPALYAKRAGCVATDLITAETECAVLTMESGFHRVFINQLDTAKHILEAKKLAGLLNVPVAGGSLF